MFDCVTVLIKGQRVPGHLIEGRTYARIRDAAEALGARVVWKHDTRTVVVDLLAIPELDMDLRLPSGASPDLINTYISGTPMDGLGQAFISAERKWGVNGLFLCALAAHESNFGRSAIARDKRNLFGWGAADDDPYGKAWTFNSFTEGIDTVTGHISVLYLNPRGQFFTAPTPAGMNRYYATDTAWAEKVVRHMSRAIEAAT